MNLTVKRMLAVSSLALSLSVLESCAAMRPGSAGPMEGVSMPFAFEGDTRVWNIGYSTENEVQRVTEMVRPGETVDNWTELVTVHTFSKAVDLASVDEMVTAHRQDLAARCPGSTLEVIQQQSDGLLYESRVVNCETGADEHVLARVLDGKSNRFVVQYAVRDPVTMTAERRAEWVEKLSEVRIMNLPGGK